MKKVKVLLLIMLMIFLSAGTSFAYSPFYMVAGNSMYPELQDGDMVEIVSEEYQDGDMVVAMKQDGAKIVKRLVGDRLVSVSDGTSYSVDEVTILGAARYTPMSLAELEEYGFRWESVLAEGEYIVQVAGGYKHSLALTNTGVVYAWGDNSAGQLGDGSGANQLIPVKVADGAMGNHDVTAIAAGQEHSLAIKKGKVYSWGANSAGQLGDGSGANQNTPVEVEDGTMGNHDVTAIAAGGSHTLALKGGVVYAWGHNWYGQLGDGSEANQNTPVKVADGAMGNNNVTTIAAGGSHSLALKGGKVYAWGYNDTGQLGDGSEANQNTPVKVADGAMGNNNVTTIAAGGSHSMALKGGVVYAWGYNWYGQLGDGSKSDRYTPVKVADEALGNIDVEAIGTALYHSFAIKDGGVYSWGYNSAGQLGDGTISNRETPVRVMNLGNAQAPQITSQPVGKTLIEGEQVTLEVVASVSGGGTLSYQWYRNTTNSNTGGTPITGATNANYSPPTDQVGTVYYYVVVTNTNNEATGNKTASVASEATAVTVLPLVHAETPVITSQPTGATVVEGDPSPTLAVSASVYDGGTLSYQWYRNTTNSNSGGTPITGETSANYSPPTDQAGTVYYYVEVTNTNHAVTGNKTATVASEAAAVTVQSLYDAEIPIITLQPSPVIATVGTTSPTIAVDAHVQEGTLSYQWYKNTINSTVGAVPIDRATDKVLEIPTDTAETAYYFVVITNYNPNATRNKIATITSKVVEVRIREMFDASPPMMTLQPTSFTVIEGSLSPILEVQAIATDGGTLSYQWYRNTINSNAGGTPIDGATSPSYPAPTDQIGTIYYYVVVTNTNTNATGTQTASVTSQVAEVTVKARNDDGQSDSDYKTPTLPSHQFVIDPKYERKVKFEQIELDFPVGVFPERFVITINKVKELPEDLQPNEESIVSEIYEITKNRKGDFQQPITVTFRLKNIDRDQYEIGIYRFDEETKEWIPLDNEAIDWNEKTVSGQAKDVAKFAVMAKEKQDDPETPLPEEEPKPEPTQNVIDIAGHWAEREIRILVEKGITKGYPDGTFRPDHPMTRAEFVAIVVRALGLELTGEKTFSDTRDHWAKDVIATAYEHGIIGGYSDTLFRPDDFITREQMAAMIVNAFQLQRGPERKTFVDEEEISSWAKEAVEAAASNGIIAGYEDGTFKPKNHATRAESVAILVRIWKESKI